MCNMSRILHRNFSALLLLVKVECEDEASPCSAMHNSRSMIDKIVASAEAALADVPDGASVMIHGFGNAGMPAALIDALIAQGARELDHRQQQRR